MAIALCQKMEILRIIAMENFYKRSKIHES